ncbi:MAG: alpha/beta fold hydrolase [Actinobacteria bacterium]|nr:alpha/beta fold hydrolase [Actinomycetota bacterium]
MPHAPANGVHLAYETFGDPADPTILLIMGLGAQMVSWDDEICHLFVDRGYHVIRFDNRDVGESTWLDTPDLDVPTALMAALGGDASHAPYSLGDMADDAVAVLDHLGIDAAHVVGASMGGMIAQTLAIEHADRVLSLTSIMSTTGNPEVGTPDGDLLNALMVERPTDPDAAVAFGVELSRLISSPVHFDEERARRRVERELARGVNPLAVPRQLLAIISSGSREEALSALDVPTLVVHGRMDRLVAPSGGERTAELVPGAELVLIDDMAHDVPAVHVESVVDRVVALAQRATAAA